MRFNLRTTPVVALLTSLALVCNLNSQPKSQPIDFRIDDPVPVTKQDGQKILLVGMQGNTVTFQFAGMEGAEASIPVDPDSRVTLTYDYPGNFSQIQSNVLNGNYKRALRIIRNPPIDLLRFVAVPESNCNFHLYSEIYYRALAFAGEPQVAIEATSVIPWESPYLPPVFINHAETLLNRMVDEKKIEASEKLLSTLQDGLSVTQFSNLALPVADKLRLLGENEIVENIYNTLSQSADEEMRKLGLIWTAYNQASTGKTEEARLLLQKIGELTEESPLFAVYCLAQGRLALAGEDSTQALRFLSRAMVRTTIADSYKPEIYFLMIQSYMINENRVPAGRLASEMAVFYPNNMWLQTATERHPEIKKEEIEIN